MPGAELPGEILDEFRSKSAALARRAALHADAIIRDRQFEFTVHAALHEDLALFAAIECVFERVRDEFVDDDGNRDCLVGAGRDLLDVATDVDVLPGKSAFDLFAQAAEVVVQPDVLEVPATKRKALACMSNRLDAIGDLVQRGPDIVVAGTLSL